MQKKQFEFGLKGFFIGLIIGVLIGLFSLNQVKKSLRAQTLPIAAISFSIFFSFSGYGIGARVGKNLYMEVKSGIDKPTEDGFLKDGRFWVGVTKWIDKRDNKQYILLTGKPNDKNAKKLISTLNGRCFLIHESTSASKESLPKLHNSAKRFVWGKIKETFNEDSFDENGHIPTIM